MYCAPPLLYGLFLILPHHHLLHHHSAACSSSSSSVPPAAGGGCSVFSPGFNILFPPRRCPRPRPPRAAALYCSVT